MQNFATQGNRSPQIIQARHLRYCEHITVVECDVDLFLTHDTEHFLQNPLIGPPETRLRVMTLYDALEWVHKRLKALAEGED